MDVPRELITFQKSIGPGVSVRIDRVPASIHGRDRIRAFNFDTMTRLEQLLREARKRMANGETKIQLDFADEAVAPDSASATDAG